jgi:hypothetical protein
MSAYLRRARHLGQRAAIGTAEPKLTSGIAFDLVTLFVHGTMVAPTEHGQVRKRRRPSLGPMTDVMALAEAHAAPREATAAVAMMKRAAQGWGNRSGPGGHLNDAAVPGVLHHHAVGVARQAPGRFRGNVLAVLEHGLAGRVGVGESRRVDVDHHLIALSRSAGIDAAVKGRLREQPKGIGLLLFHSGWFVVACAERGRFRGNVRGVGAHDEGSVGALIQGLPRGGQRLDEELADLGLEPSANPDHTVVITVDV